MPAPAPIAPFDPGRCFTLDNVVARGLNEAMPALRVVIAEDAYIAREGTRRLLDERDDADAVGTARDDAEVLEAARRLEPDVVSMDVKMLPTHSMEARLRRADSGGARLRHGVPAAGRAGHHHRDTG